MKYKRLKNSPIVEAVFCVDLAGVPPFTKESVNGICSLIAPEYKFFSNLVSRSLTFDTTEPSRPIKPTDLWSGAQFRKSSNHALVLSNIDAQIIRLSYSRVRTYESWESFITIGRGIVNNFINKVNTDPVVKRVAVRFINKLKPQSAHYKMSDILTCLPCDQQSGNNMELRELFYKDTYWYDDYKLNATSVKAVQRNHAGEGEVIVDTDVFSTPNDDFSNINWDELLEKLHELKNVIFFSSVKKDFVESVLDYVE